MVRRQTDPALKDCGLTPRGFQQALALKASADTHKKMDLILCSPLTRALQTALLTFSSSNKRILVNYDLREIGKVPENQPRPWKQVFADLAPLVIAGASHNCGGGNNSDTNMDIDHPDALEASAASATSIERIDVDSLAPRNMNVMEWPKGYDKLPNVLRRDAVKAVFVGLARELQTQRQSQQYVPNIAVVCHFHVIRAALTDGRGFCDASLKPGNAVPIPCWLTDDGKLLPC